MAGTYLSTRQLGGLNRATVLNGRPTSSHSSQARNVPAPLHRRQPEDLLANMAGRPTERSSSTRRGRKPNRFGAPCVPRVARRASAVRFPSFDGVEGPHVSTSGRRQADRHADCHQPRVTRVPVAAHLSPTVPSSSPADTGVQPKSGSSATAGWRTPKRRNRQISLKTGPPRPIGRRTPDADPRKLAPRRSYGAPDAAMAPSTR